VVTLTATVANGTKPVTPGQVDFCDATVSYCTDIHLLGTAQLTNAGMAVLKILPGNGPHSFRAVFRGTNSFAPSASATSSLTVAGTNASITAISSSGSIGNYTLSATVGSTGDTSETGDISFLNTTSGNTPLGSATLLANFPAWAFMQSSSIPVVPAYGTNPFGVTGDVNGDGLVDVVTSVAYGCIVGNCGNAKVMAALGDGRGAFTAAAALDLGRMSMPLPPIMADFDSDGVLDLAVTDNHGSITFLKGNGGGTFSLKGTSSTGSSFNSWTIGDFNHDGIPDLALISSVVLIYRGNGDGTFSASTAAPTPIGGNTIVAGDFNGDGQTDLAVSNATTGTVTILLGNGDETFQVGQSITFDATFGVRLLAADLNEDGKLDLAVTHQVLPSYEPAVTVLLGNGDGTFSPTAQSPVTVTGRYGSTSAADLAFGDFNGSGHASLAIDYGGNGQIQVLPGVGDGTLGSAVQVFSDHLLAAICVADFNGDGSSDIATGLTLFSVNQTATATVNGVSLPAASGSAQAIARFAGDDNYLPSTSTSTTLYAAQGTPTVSLTALSNPAPYGSPVTLTVAVLGSGLTPTGTVQLFDGSTSLGMATLNSKGTAIYQATGLSTRVHSILASYSGDPNYVSAASQVLSLTINAAATAVLTTSAPFLPTGTPDIFIATFTGSAGTPTGLVSFQDAGTQIAQVPLNSGGTATYGTNSLADGTHTIVAAYGGDNNYAPFTSSSVQVVSSSKPFLSITGTGMSIAAGATSGNSVTVSVTPTQGFVGAVSLSAAVTSSPVGAQFLPTVSFGSTSSVNITGTSPATATLTVNTTAAHMAALVRPNGLRALWYEGAGAFLACIFLFGMPARRRSLRRMAGFLVLLASMMWGVTACGGGGTSSGTIASGTTAGAYTITVTATSGPVSQQGTITMTVQ
jgi:hypothetical protein